MNQCVKCEKQLTGNQKRYCSTRCSKLFLKAEYKKRHRDKLNEYAREYRRAKNGGNRSLKNPKEYRDTECLYCGVTENLQVCHVKPLWAGGTHAHTITLCQIHHYRFDNLLREYWKQSVELRAQH